jgi:hypothetical protein
LTFQVDALQATGQRRRAPGGIPMLDIVMVAMGLVFFALSIGYTISCSRL